MKPIVAIIVFFSLMVPSLFLGYANYMTAKENIIEDVNQALVKTVLSSHPERITADTLRVFKSNLQIGQLKGTSYLSLCTDEPSKVSFCSDTVISGLIRCVPGPLSSACLHRLFQAHC